MSSLPRRKYKKKMLKIKQNTKKEDRSQGDHMNPLFKYLSSMHKKSMENKNNKIVKMLPNCFFHDIESNFNRFLDNLYFIFCRFCKYL